MRLRAIIRRSSLLSEFFFSLLSSVYGIFRFFYSFTAPVIVPEIRNFWKNGKAIIIGNIVNISAAFLTCSILRLLPLISKSAELAEFTTVARTAAKLSFRAIRYIKEDSDTDSTALRLSIILSLRVSVRNSEESYGTKS